MPVTASLSFGLGLWPNHPPAEAARLAAIAEAHGFEGIWVPDERFHRDCYLTLGSVARETVRARQADSTIAAELLGQARQLVDAGVSPAIDATRSEVSYASVRTQLEVARNASDRTRLDLLRSLDLPSGTRTLYAAVVGG